MPREQWVVMVAAREGVMQSEYQSASDSNRALYFKQVCYNKDYGQALKQARQQDYQIN